MKLYHYTSGQGLFGIVESKELHFSNINFLNDPTELNYFQTIIDLVCTRNSLCEKIYSTLFDESYEDFMYKPSRKFIASFSKNNDSLSMWNYYSKGNGYNIGFNVDTILKRYKGIPVQRNVFSIDYYNRKMDIEKLEMIYEEHIQIEETEKLILNYQPNLQGYIALMESIEHPSELEIGAFTKKDPLYYQADFIKSLFSLSMRFKHPAYKDEDEVRLVLSLGDKVPTKFKVSANGVFVEYYPFKLTLSEDMHSITVHPINNDLHLTSTKRMIAEKIKKNRIDVNRSNIPFRIV